MQTCVRIASALAAVLPLVSCGGGSTIAPTAANVAGAWSGTLSFTTAAAGPAAQPVTLNLTQDRAGVFGLWQTTGGTIPMDGTITGTTTVNAFSGTFTSEITNPSTGASCNGTGSVSGSAGGTTLTWTSSGVRGGGTVDPPTNLTFAVNRQ